MEEDPFALLEAMTIAAFATGCEQGYIYIRGGVSRGPERLRMPLRRHVPAACWVRM